MEVVFLGTEVVVVLFLGTVVVVVCLGTGAPPRGAKEGGMVLGGEAGWVVVDLGTVGVVVPVATRLGTDVVGVVVVVPEGTLDVVVPDGGDFLSTGFLRGAISQVL